MSTDPTRLDGGTDYTVESQQRLMRLVSELASHPLDGMANAQIAERLCVTRSTVTRDLANLRATGWAEQIPETGRWRCGPAVIRLSVAHATAMSRAQQRLDEVRQRFGGSL